MGLDMYLVATAGDQEVEVGYWCKANSIHAWFVDNCADGVDDCQPHPVTREQLSALLALVEAVRKDPSRGPELLPTRSGFFFGSTAYDDDYLFDLRLTAKILAKALASDYSDFYYRASW